MLMVQVANQNLLNQLAIYDQINTIYNFRVLSEATVMDALVSCAGQDASLHLIRRRWAKP